MIADGSHGTALGMRMLMIVLLSLRRRTLISPAMVQCLAWVPVSVNAVHACCCSEWSCLLALPPPRLCSPSNPVSSMNFHDSAHYQSTFRGWIPCSSDSASHAPPYPQCLSCFAHRFSATYSCIWSSAATIPSLRYYQWFVEDLLVHLLSAGRKPPDSSYGTRLAWTPILEPNGRRRELLNLNLKTLVRGRKKVEL